MPSTRSLSATIGVALAAAVASADHTNNIMLTGYWPPTNEMVRHFSTSAEQNPGGWQGANWEGRGYDVYSFFPEFPDGVGRGVGDFEVDYQDTSADFWRIVAEVNPVAIITFSRGDLRRREWEIETAQRNLDEWVPDYDEPYQPTPAPPDDSVPAGYVRYSSLPIYDIEAAVDGLDNGVNARVDETGFGGGFLSEFIAYHGVWYQSIHADPSDPNWCVAAGHIHVGNPVSVEQGMEATHATLRALTDYLDDVIPAPGSAAVLAMGLGAIARRRRSE